MMKTLSTDLKLKIALYLPFEDKYRFGQAYNKNFLCYYNFRKKYKNKEKNLTDIFYFSRKNSKFNGESNSESDTESSRDEDDKYEEYLGYRSDLYERFYHDLTKCYEHYDKKHNINHEDSSEDSYDDSDSYCSCRELRYDHRYQSVDDLYYNVELGIQRRNKILDPLFYDDFDTVYIRMMIEYIEDNEIEIEYKYKEIVFNLNNDLNEEIYDKTVEYYKETYYKNEDLLYELCLRCGQFGHSDSDSKDCLFYENEDKIKKRKKNTITNIMKL